MASDLFYFKNFVLFQKNTAMKSGMDSMILGSYIQVGVHVKNVLDIGTGTGILSLMIAQKSNAQIQAIEIDKSAFADAQYNFENSIWKNRLHLIHANILDFKDTTRYDLIVCNPPYFKNGKTSTDLNARQVARNQGQLSLQNLPEIVAELLTEKGSFYVVLPFSEVEAFIKTALMKGLYLLKSLQIRSYETQAFIRSILVFSFQEVLLQSDVLTIYESTGKYTEAYKNLTKDFHARTL